MFMFRKNQPAMQAPGSEYQANSWSSRASYFPLSNNCASLSK